MIKVNVHKCQLFVSYANREFRLQRAGYASDVPGEIFCQSNHFVDAEFLCHVACMAFLVNEDSSSRVVWAGQNEVVG